MNSVINKTINLLSDENCAKNIATHIESSETDCQREMRTFTSTSNILIYRNFSAVEFNKCHNGIYYASSGNMHKASNCDDSY